MRESGPRHAHAQAPHTGTQPQGYVRLLFDAPTTAAGAAAVPLRRHTLAACAYMGPHCLPARHICMERMIRGDSSRMYGNHREYGLALCAEKQAQQLQQYNALCVPSLTVCVVQPVVLWWRL
uniref:Uncharacterized protein n=1 Tax=Ascaris lumbricoides TaxID=6252 RepID=A0A0M3HPX9_ASCLU